jgi:hypothetical protein
MRRVASARATRGCWRTSGSATCSRGDTSAPIGALDAALRSEPDHAFATGVRVELRRLQGRTEEAAELAAGAVRAHPGDARLLTAYARLAPGIDASDHAIDLLRARLDAPDAAGATRVELLHALALLLDERGEHGAAFRAADEGNRLAPARFDPGAWSAAIDRMIERWRPEAIAGLPVAGGRSDLPVLIVGAPRSGTTLVERMLASHPLAHGGGELERLDRLVARLRGLPPTTHQPLIDDPASLARAGLDAGRREYLAALRSLGGRARRVTDKMPGNLLHLGLAQLMLPGARAVLCRRDPRDVAVSCFLHSFMGSHPWSARPGWLAVYLNTTRRLADHWIEALELPIHVIDYETLVADAEPVVRDALGFLGLEPDPACLDFHGSPGAAPTASSDQVRKPLYTTSRGRWRNYERALAPCFDALDP